MDNLQSALRVLIIEDSDDDALLITRELTRGGFSVEHHRVDTPNSLQSALHDRQWDIVITDYNMPGFNPSHALKILQEKNIDIPVIMVSGSVGEDIAVETMKAGAHDYIMKDNMARLVPAIKRELREASNRMAHRDAEATIRHLAFHDALTGLANRYEFEQQLTVLLHSCTSTEQRHCLLYLDLDQFKLVNDTSGHAAGDELLRQLAILLKSHIRSSDTLARLGGDEFGIIIRNCQIPQAEIMANNLLTLLQEFRFNWDDRIFTIGGSIGMIPLSNKTQNPAEAMQAADMACYAAKDRGRNCVQLYSINDEELHRRQGEMHWVPRLKTAIEEDHFQLYIQAITPLSVKAANTFHSEFLLRLIDDDGSIITPDAFIPAAERYGMMPEIDRWVVSKALQHIAHHNDVSVDQYFINLSGASLGDKKFCSFVKHALSENESTRARICFEITETAAITNFDKALTFIQHVRASGCHFALDDFGSGLSSFSYLKALPVDFLKIDGVFIRDITHDPVDRAIIESIQHVAKTVGLQVIAEWVESEETLDALKAIGIDYAQGFHVGCPHPA